MEYNMFRITEIIRGCGEIMLSAHTVDNEKDAIEIKAGAANFVTKYDKGVQNKLISELTAEFPNACFFAEEKENSLDILNSELLFVIDPIDGTTNFIHDMKCSAISVGAFSFGKPVFGIVYDPYKKEMFTAEKGKGAFCNGKPIHVSDRTLDVALVAFGTVPYERDTYADRIFEEVKRVFMKCADIRRSGSAALDICSVACGRNDAFFEDKLSYWDFAAGSVILTEAGGRCSTTYGEELVSSGTSSFLCTNNTVHEDIVKLIKGE